MVDSYAGIITSHGLEFFVRETEHCAPFLFRRAYRTSRPEAVCFWAVLPDSAATQIACSVQCTCFREALANLNERALYFGVISPPTRDEMTASGLRDTP